MVLVVAMVRGDAVAAGGGQRVAEVAAHEAACEQPPDSQPEDPNARVVDDKSGDDRREP